MKLSVKCGRGITMKTLQIILILGVLSLGAADEMWGSALFRRPGHYSFSYSARADTGFAVLARARSPFALAGVLHVTVPARGLPLVVQLQDLKHASQPGTHASPADTLSYARPPAGAAALGVPFQLNLHRAPPTLGLREAEPLWSVNMKRALAAALQMPDREMPGAFKVNEPCLHGMCVVEYSSSDGRVIRKSYNVPTLAPTPSHRLWVSVMPNVCNKDIKNPLAGNSEKWYTLDDSGMVKLESYGSIEIHYHKHILKSSVNITLERLEISELPQPQTEAFPVEVGLAFEPPPTSDPSGARATPSTEQRLESLYGALSRAAEGLERHGPRDTLLRDKLPLEIHGIMSGMSFEGLKAAHDELELGTSYMRETMRNIFLEALPQCTNPDSAMLVRDLVQQGRAGEATLQMLRKLPFSVQELGPTLLEKMEPLLKLGQEHPSAVRHAAILAYSTLVFRTFISGACTEDMFEEYVQIYFSRFTESPDYADRLAWLMGLSNLQLQQVRTYLAPIIGGGLGHSGHERFLAVWATMPLAHLYPQEVHDLYWPILQNPNESLEMRVAACTMLLTAEPSPHRLLSLHWYISAQSSGHLKHFFYTTIKSMEHTTYDCYKHLAKLSSYLGRLVVNPGTRFWATGNYLMDVGDFGRDMGLMAQTLMVADPTTGLPNVFYFTLAINNAGLVVTDFAVYLKLQGVAGSFLAKLRRLSGDSVRLERLVDALREVHAEVRVPALVHVELLLKHQGKTVMALHVNQTAFDKWTSGDITLMVNSFLQAESHVNQQTLLYPTLLSSILPSELGMPVRTDTMLASLTSMRGNLTHDLGAEEIARKNDVHFRTSWLALIGLSAYNPIANSHHTAEVAQVVDIYLPANFTLAMSLPTKAIRTSWLQPSGILGPGMTAYSGAKVIWKPEGDESRELSLKTGRTPLKATIAGVTLVCEGLTNSPQLLWQLLNSHKSNAETVPWAKPLMILTHAAALAAIPAEGACSLSMLPGTAEEVPVRTDRELELLQAPSSKLHFRVGVVRRRESDGTVLSRMNVTCMLELGDNRAKAVAKYVGTDSPGAEEWKVCLETEAKAGPLQVRVAAAYGAGGHGGPCPTRSQLGLLLDENKTGYRLAVTAKSVPSPIAEIAARASSLLEPWRNLAGPEGGAALEASALVSRVLAASASGITNETAQLRLAQGPEDGLAKLAAAGSQWLLGPASEMKLLGQLGVIRECRITAETILTLKGKERPLRNDNCTLLLLGDCTRTPHFALFMQPSTQGLHLRLYTGGNYVDITAPGGELAVTVNDEKVQWKPSYQYPEGEKFYDFKIFESDKSITIDSKLGALSMKVGPRQAVLQLPATQLDKVCGKCMAEEQHFSKC